MAEQAARRARVERLLAAAGILADPRRAEGHELRRRLRETSGLSAAGLELGLEHGLERHASKAELDALVSATPEATRAHVLLSSNVCVAALRAIALAAAAAPRVFVRASRRDPALPEALHALVPDAFQMVEDLTPEPGDHVWAYGADETLSQVRSGLPRGVWFHAHGHGFGAVVVETSDTQLLVAQAHSIALDTVLFDQRGCLSPRVVCVAGSERSSRALAEALAQALAALELQVPLGVRTHDELAAARRFRDAAAYAFELLPAGQGAVSLSLEGHLVLPPVARHLHVLRASDVVRALTPFRQHLTCIGASTGPTLEAELQTAFTGTRWARLGEMQRPPLDGPVDRRLSPLGERLL